jgi:curli biogenesis system outer membrane secretion channel CsgG
MFKKIRRMSMVKRIMLISVIALFGVTALNAAEPVGLKKRVAVFSFEDKSDHKIRWWRQGQNVGEGMADMLITALVKKGKFTVLERTELNRVLEEQKLGASGAVTAQTAAQVGDLLGVELAIVGAVTEYGFKQQSTDVGVGSGVTNKLFKKTNLLKGNSSVGTQSTSIRVGVDVRFTDVTTGEIVAAENVAKEEKSVGLSFSSGVVTFENEKGFDESIVGKATRDAIDEIVVRIEKQMEKISWAGRIIKADGSSVIINAGAKVGISIGDEMLVYSKGEDLIDPATGLNLGSEEKQIGKIKVISDIADGKASTCELTEGSGGKNGDIVRYPKN